MSGYHYSERIAAALRLWGDTTRYCIHLPRLANLATAHCKHGPEPIWYDCQFDGILSCIDKIIFWCTQLTSLVPRNTTWFLNISALNLSPDLETWLSVLVVWLSLTSNASNCWRTQERQHMLQHQNTTQYLQGNGHGKQNLGVWNISLHRCHLEAVACYWAKSSSSCCWMVTVKHLCVSPVNCFTRWQLYFYWALST